KKKKEVDNSSLQELGFQVMGRNHVNSEIEDAIEKYAKKRKSNKKEIESKNIRRFFCKEFFDRISYGFGSQQFINILFFHTGASFFTIGMINGIRVILNLIISFIVDEYSKIKTVSRKFIGATGIIFGFSFIIMAMARLWHSVPLFIFALLIGSIGAVSYGELYQKLFRDIMKRERSNLLRNISHYGLIITGVSIVLGGYIMDKFPATGTLVSFLGYEFRLFGYFIAFEIAAISSILAGYFLAFLKEKHVSSVGRASILTQINIRMQEIKKNVPVLITNKVILTLFIASLITGLVQTLANSFYGIYLYETFKNGYFKGFANIAVIFLIAIMTSFFSPYIVRKNARDYGKLPMMVFGTLLMAIMPLTYYYNPNLVSIAVGTLIGFIGAAIIGVAHGLITTDIMSENERKIYFSSYSILIIIPYLIIVPLGSYFAQVYGLKNLFLFLGLILALIVVPLYLAIIVLYNKKEKI
ncbi:MAG: hypothetical protein PHV16_05355, partial [Candidatus Nanoarchaeia archaeon]|nr:hypothetical protein [Candidatus Nanoarchaeia archaeon]